jgi:hypothetical protein
MAQAQCPLWILRRALAWNPSDGLTGTIVYQRFGIFLGKAGRPLLKVSVREFHGLGVGALQRAPEFLTAPPLKFLSYSLRYEPAAVLLDPVDLSNEVVGPAHGDSFNAAFILRV